MKPTLRKNGKMMFTISVKVHIGMESLIELGNSLLKDNRPLPTSRTAWLRLARQGASLYGRCLVY